MTDSDTDRETVPTTTYLPDHLLAGQSKIPAVRSVEASDEGTETADDEADTDDDPTAEFCRSWRRHRSESRSFPF